MMGVRAGLSWWKAASAYPLYSSFKEVGWGRGLALRLRPAPLALPLPSSAASKPRRAERAR